MISIVIMVKFGKIYENLMVDVNVINVKLKVRVKCIVV